MATFTGTADPETITPLLVTATVVTVPPGAKPSNADDVISAGAGNDAIDAGGGNDTVSGQQGDDIAQLGAGDDRFIWNPGDGNDTVDGSTGADTLDFFGNGANENIELSADSDRLRFFRDVASVTLDVVNVENVTFHALGGTDSITVGDLSATDVTQVTINLEGTLGSGAGDAQLDTAILSGSDIGSLIDIAGVDGNIAVSGLPAAVAISAVEATDALVINALGGNDTISAASLGTMVSLTIDAGNGNDIVTGSARPDVILGGAGNDTVTGRQGDDVAFLGAGSDRFIWNPGDGNDTIEGQAQTDTLEFNGSGVNENFDLSANGGRTRFFRDVASVTMDMDDVETLVLDALGGANQLTVGNLSGTDLVGPITYIGGVAVDTVNASAAFNDMIVTGGGGADSLTGGSGDDIFRYSAASDAVAGEVVAGGIGIGDTLQLVNAGSVEFRPLTLSGLERLQFVSGNSIATFNFNQVGGTGIETVIGGAGNDTVTVKGNLVDLSALLFSGWNDATDLVVLYGSGGTSTLIGTEHRDYLTDSVGVDNMSGAGGDDSYRIDDIGDKVFEEAGAGTDTVFAEVSYALGAAQEIEILSSTGGTDPVRLDGNAFAQRINGNNGNNILFGAAGNDLLVGYGGNDNLEGGFGADTLKGVTGIDKFVFRQNQVAASGADHIADFGADDFVFFDHPSATGVLNPAALVLGTDALDADDRFVYQASTGSLWFDQDGNGSTAKILFAILDNKFALTASDIVLF